LSPFAGLFDSTNDSYDQNLMALKCPKIPLQGYFWPFSSSFGTLPRFLPFLFENNAAHHGPNAIYSLIFIVLVFIGQGARKHSHNHLFAFYVPSLRLRSTTSGSTNGKSGAIPHYISPIAGANVMRSPFVGHNLKNFVTLENNSHLSSKKYESAWRKILRGKKH